MIASLLSKWLFVANWSGSCKMDYESTVTVTPNQCSEPSRGSYWEGILTRLQSGPEAQHQEESVSMGFLMSQ